MSLVGKTDSCIAQVLERQHLVISRGQALGCGQTKTMLQHRLRDRGPWQRLLPGIYLAATGTPNRDQLDMAALLYAGAGSAITGLAALRRLKVRAPTEMSVDVLVPAARRSASRGFVTVHRTTRMPRLVGYDGPLVFALAARATADAARRLATLSEVRALVAGVVQQGWCTVAQLEAELAAGPIRGSAPLRTVLAEVGEGVRSSPEADLRVLLNGSGLPTPLFNPRIYANGVFLASPDAWWPEAGLAVEVDSREWHLSPEAWEATMRRHARMTAVGILVLHFSPRQIHGQPGVVLRDIGRALRAGRPVAGITTRPAGE
jgi:hypothetical protein